jgi:hypothetical protein
VLKSDLFKLIRDVRSVSKEEPLIIAGSQAAHAVTDHLPEIARRSIECDFLFAGGKAELREVLNKKLGVLTEYQEEQGFYADAVGLATIVLPSGWEERLLPLEDESGNIVANCIDIYDVAVSKLMAGRDKDLVFLESIFASDLIFGAEFLQRSCLVKSKVENDVLKDRLTRLIKKLESTRIHFDLAKQIKDFIRQRENQSKD